MGLYYLIFRRSVRRSATWDCFFILIPFDQRVRWNDRPMYQRVWLVVYVVLVFVVMGWFFWLGTCGANAGDPTDHANQNASLINAE